MGASVSHTHWPTDSPRHRVCVYRTKKECAAAISAWKAEVKGEAERRKLAAKAAERARREVDFIEYEEGQRQRVAAILAAEERA